jgi:hypothetical protein
MCTFGHETVDIVPIILWRRYLLNPYLISLLKAMEKELFNRELATSQPFHVQMYIGMSSMPQGKDVVLYKYESCSGRL